MNRERLTILRDYLSTIPPEEYDQIRYGSFDQNGLFTGCAAAHAAHCPAFNELGFKARDFGDTKDNDLVIPIYEGYGSGHEATEAFFELSMNQLEHIFFGTSNKNSRDVQETVSHINDVLEGRIP